MPDDGQQNVAYTVKELLHAIQDKLDLIDAKLEKKADQILVNELSTRINLAMAQIPPKLLEEHRDLQTRAVLTERELVDLRGDIKKLYEWHESAVSVKALIVPSIALLVSVIWTVFSIFNALFGHPPI